MKLHVNIEITDEDRKMLKVLSGFRGQTQDAFVASLIKEKIIQYKRGLTALDKEINRESLDKYDKIE
jgi:hypothetical protein